MVRRAALAALAVATAALLSGCGAVDHMSASDGDASNGKTLFSQKCASCHELADAKATGTIGPSLDDAFASVRRQQFDESTIRDVVRGMQLYRDQVVSSSQLDQMQAAFDAAQAQYNSAQAAFSHRPQLGKLKALMCTATPWRGVSR